MANNFNEKAYNAVTDAAHFDIDDILALGANYFRCGWGEEMYYNHSFSIAIAIIGSIYGSKKSGRSDYHNGITFIASELGITKRQIKVLRKKMKHKDGFSFKTPYNVSTTLKKIIDLLKRQEQNPNVKKFLSQQRSEMYREFLIEKQFEAIKEAAKKGKREKVKNVADELRGITTKVGE